ncbi:7029_t:CDS:2, partial [Entrophospora sp. SA101]
DEKENIHPLSNELTRGRKIIGGTVTLFAGKGIPIGISSFNQIVERNFTFLDKTLLIADFLECSSAVSVIVRPRRFGKTTNISMLKNFFSIPNDPDNIEYRHELFKNTKIIE